MCECSFRQVEGREDSPLCGIDRNGKSNQLFLADCINARAQLVMEKNKKSMADGRRAGTMERSERARSTAEIVFLEKCLAVGHAFTSI